MFKNIIEIFKKIVKKIKSVEMSKAGIASSE